MGVPFKKIARKDPRKADAVAKFYPQLVTLGDNATLDDIAYVMKEKSSLTLGDIQSVLTNFVEAMITTLYSGQSVNIKNFGVFSLSAANFKRGGTAMFALLAMFGDLGCSLGPWLTGVMSDAAQSSAAITMDSLKFGVLVGTVFPLIMLGLLVLLRRRKTE